MTRSSASDALFVAPRLLRNGHLQSMLASLKVRRLALAARGRTRMRSLAREVILDAGDGVRLQGFQSTPEGRPCGLVAMIHGWEGCSESNYLLAVGEALFEAGFEVFRLNLRDHGDTHSLNEGMFHANRIDEVVGAFADLGRRSPARPFVVVGFSLGGNFALRVALRAPGAGLPIERVVAVNPALDPPGVCDAIDRYPIYRRYFLGRWHRSLSRKQAAFPHLYDFRGLERHRSVRELTERVIPLYTPFRSSEEYFEAYTLTGDRLAALELPTTILTSRDDPIIDRRDFENLPRSPSLRVEMTDHGGHCGYIAGPGLVSWLERRVPELLA